MITEREDGLDRIEAPSDQVRESPEGGELVADKFSPIGSGSGCGRGSRAWRGADYWEVRDMTELESRDESTDRRRFTVYSAALAGTS